MKAIPYFTFFVITRDHYSLQTDLSHVYLKAVDTIGKYSSSNSILISIKPHLVTSKWGEADSIKHYEKRLP